MSNTGYTADRQYLPYVINIIASGKTYDRDSSGSIIGRARTNLYWLAKETGISHTTLWRLKKDKALGINFETLEKICEALKCQPGDILALPSAKKQAKKSAPARRNGRTRK